MAPCEFCSNFLVLRPNKANPIKLLRFLWSGYIAEGADAMIECPKGEEEENRKHKVVIFLSLLVQMILLWIAKPLRCIGSAFEWLLNLPSSNQNWRGLIHNVLHGNLKQDRESPSFMSAIGYTDKRVKLDKTISRKDSKYYGALSAMAAKIAYENEAFIKNTVENHWKMELIEFNNFWNVCQKKDTTQAFLLHDKNTDPDDQLIVVAFRGTEPFDADAWSTDFDISWFEYGPLGKVHGGFMNALGLTEKEGLPKELKQDNHHPLAYYTIRRHLRNLVRLDNNTKFIVTGHSLGGALAILFTAILALHDEELLLKRLEGVYTFGQPRVGDEVFQKFMEKQTEVHDIKYHRIVYGNDLVPRVPSDNPTFLFKHFGTCLYYNSFYKQKALEEEPNKNYFDHTAAMSKHLTAIWELIRSFIIPYAEGPEYKESWLLKAIRVFGVIIPGVAAHNPQDYVNATRLG